MEEKKTHFEEYLGLHDLISDDEMQEHHEQFKLYPEEVKHGYIAARREIQFGQAVDAESSNFKSSLKYLKDEGGLLGDKPLTVIMAGKKPTVEECGGRLTQEEINECCDVFWPGLQADHATKSLRGKLIVAEKSGHMIPAEQPEIIVEAVREMVEELRGE